MFPLALVCVVLASLVWCFAPLWGAVWCCPPAPCVLCTFFSSGVCWSCCPPRWLVVVPCVVRCRASYCVVLWCVVCLVLCLVLCGVLVFGWVGAPCWPARCCAGSGCAAFAVLCCRVLLCSLVVFFFALFLAFPWCSELFLSVWCSPVVRLAVRCGPVVLRSSAGLSCVVLFGALFCRGASLGSTLCCWIRCGAWVASCLVRCCGRSLCSVRPWARCCVVLLCCLWSGCCRSLCRVSWRLPFRGASFAVLCWCACVVALCAMLSRPSGTGWCCVLLPVVFWRLLLGLAVLCCLLVDPGGS